MAKQFAALESQIHQLNSAMAATVAQSAAVDPAGYARMAQVMNTNANTFRNAALSTGQFEAHQLRLNSATDEYIKKLRAQKISFREWRKDLELSKAAYREQLAMQDMVVRKGMTTVGGRQTFDVIVPQRAHEQLDTLGNKIGWIREQVKSASTQMVNWGKNTQWAGRQLMVGFTMPVAAFGAAAGVMAYQVDKQMVRIQKVYDTTADAGSKSAEEQMKVERELLQVREDSMENAIEVAKRYGVAVTDTLEIAADLAATGKKGQELQKTTSEVMRIATLGEMEHQDALNASIALQSVFKMSTDELTESFNYMNAVENATSLQLADFAKAIPIAAGPVKQFGGDIKELGVLLTAMRENGIPATQGANALKAAMQRLLRPSKQVRKEFTELTGKSITDIVAQSESLTDIFKAIGEVTEGLSQKDAGKVYAGLFGTYQVQRMSAMVQGMKDLENGVGQVSAAYRLSSQDAQEWADAAERETNRYAESASGQFKIALETVKGELAEMGEPFLEIASDVLQVIAKIAGAFNDLPDGTKKFVAYSMIIGATIGPLIMLAGLTANLAGNLLKFGAAITSVLGKMEILDRDSRAAKLAAEVAAQGFQHQFTAAQKLRHELELLAKAQHAANRESFALVAADIQARNPGMKRSEAYAQMAATRRSALASEGLWDLEDNASIQRTADKMDDIAGSSEKAKVNWKRIGGHVGVATSSLAIMAMTSEGAVGDFASMVFYASMLGPAALALGAGIKASLPHLKSAASSAKTKLASSLATARAESVLLAGGISKSEAPMKRLGGSIKTGAGRLAGMIGTTNLIAAAAVAAGFAFYKLHQNIKEAHKEQIAQQKAITDSTSLWAKHLGVVERKYDTISRKQGQNLTDPEKSTIEIAREIADTKQGERIGEVYKEADAQGKRTLALQEYLKVLNQTDGTAEDAQRALEIMFLVAGDGMIEAQRKAREFNMEFGGELNNGNLGELWAGQITEASNQTVDEAKVVGTEIGRNLADAIANADTAAGQAAILNRFEGSLNKGMERVISNISPEFRKNLAAIGADSGEEIERILSDWNDVAAGTLSRADFTGKWNFESISVADQALLKKQLDIYGQMSSEIFSQQAARKAALNEIAAQLGIESEIASVKELQGSWEWKMYTLNKKRAKVMWEQYLAAQDTTEATTEEGRIARLNYLNDLRRNAGLKETGELSDGLRRRTKDINGNIIDWKKNQDGVNDKLRDGLNLTSRQKAILDSIESSDIGDMFKDAMSSYQEGIADNTMESFDRQMDAAISGMESANEDAIERQERRQDRAMERFDRFWENRIAKAEKFHDRRIEGINKQVEAEQKADDIRQRLFDAEMARLDRLNSMANRNIDFNVALNSGNFDEAAKIRNDAEAEATGWALSDANERAGRRSEKRIDRLEKQINRFENIKDNRLDALKEIEEAERKALQRTHDRRKKALKEDLDQTLEAERKKWDVQKKRLEDALDHFKGYVATSDKDLRKHMKQWEARYKQFNLTTEGQFDATTDNIAKYLERNLKDSQREFANGRDWQLSGAKIANNMLQGAFGMNTQQFRRFLVTGVWPKGAGKPPTIKEIKGNFDKNYPNKNAERAFNRKLRGDSYSFRHTGGIVDGGRGSRKGVARTAPLHRTEIPTILRRGEGVLNEKVMEKLGPEGFNAINSGKFGTDEKGVGGGGPGMGFSGIMAALMARAVMSSIQTGVNTGMVSGMSRMMSAEGSFLAGKAGVYGDRHFGPSQLNLAATIASIGSKMGMSQRDIMIGIMTAITESGLGLPTQADSDRDSAGLFQQRPSQGWGTVAQVMDPVYASRKFFAALKGISGRNDMSPWLAAQAVQRSAYSDGSNYRQYWDEANAIFRGLGKSAGLRYAPGRGGWHRPAKAGYGWGNTHDYQVPIGTPLYAVSDGRVIESRDITSGGSPGNGLYRAPNGQTYRSYGATVAMRTASGDIFRWAHLSPGTRIGLGPIKGGTMIGRSGNTGNSTGPHVHMDVNGNYNALGWLRQHGIQLKTGGYTMTDGLANLHKNEVVISPERTAKLYEGIDRFAEGAGGTYNVNMYITEPGASADEIANKAILKIRRMESRRPQSRRG